MAAVIPQILTGTATTTPGTLTPSRAARQFLVENLGTTNNLLLTWNGGANWTVKPGGSVSMYLKGSVVTLSVAASASTTTYQILLQD